jgi:hypothetical protein
MKPIVVVPATILCAGLSVVLVTGWMHGGREKTTRGPFILFSRIGFVLGTSSALIAIMTVICVALAGSFPYHDPTLRWIYAIAIIFSLLAVASAIIGARRSSVLRWHALVLSSGMLLLWCMWVSGE